MPRVIVEWLVGRTKDQRDTIAKEITDTFVKNANVRSDQVTVVFKENLPDLQYKGGESYKPIKKAGD
jgi:phenylpyruvate tautomerase PptA (4-oxalocrotonate tautomerase family)